MIARMERIAARMGAGPPLCERCGRSRPTVHHAYGEGDA